MKGGVPDRVFEHQQREQIGRTKLGAVAPDSTVVIVRPNGTGALKKRAPICEHVPKRLVHQGSLWLPPMLELT